MTTMSPALAYSPASRCLRVITPSNGALTSESSNCFSAIPSEEAACVSRAAASSAAAFARANPASACLNVVSARSKASSVMALSIS